VLDTGLVLIVIKANVRFTQQATLDSSGPTLVRPMSAVAFDKSEIALLDGPF